MALLPILFGILVASSLIGFALHYRFLSRLRTRHPETWAALGHPRFIMNNSIANGIAVQRFLLRKEYMSLGDSEFAHLAGIVRAYGIIYLTFFFGVVVYFLAVIKPE